MLNFIRLSNYYNKVTVTKKIGEEEEEKKNK